MKGRDASIAARLKMVATRKHISFQYASLLYMHEGFLRRLSASPHRDRFVLKGGLLLHCLSDASARTTKDIDLLGQDISIDANSIKEVITAIVSISEDDALRFDPRSQEVEAIVEGNDYHGLRIRVPCYLGNIRNTVQVDIAFGDAVVSPLKVIEYPILIDGRSFCIASYPLSTIVAEKFEAMVALGDINSRMKDFWDVVFLLDNYDIPEEELLRAIVATFRKRDTPQPADPIVFDAEFSHSEPALTKWKAFIKRSHLPDQDWSDTLLRIRNRLRPIYDSIFGLPRR